MSISSTLSPDKFPSLLRETPHPPEQLFLQGNLPSSDIKLLTVVGSRKYTSYGKQILDHLLDGLQGYPVGIVSGLALGIDGLAHRAALRNNLYTLAIPGSGLGDKVLYPAAHKQLAKQILDEGGGLMSEYDHTQKAAPWTFPKRNRLVAGISHATLLVEAAEQSGTLITARLATDYNRDLLVVPGSIFSKNHVGIHQFLKLGATPVTTSEDILHALGIDPIRNSDGAAAKLPRPTDLSSDQKQMLNLLIEPLPKDELIRQSGLPTEKAAQLLMMMELDGLVVCDAGVYRINM